MSDEERIKEMLKALKLARAIMRDFGLWKTKTVDTEIIRAAIAIGAGRTERTTR
jgi:hypothetical protein